MLGLAIPDIALRWRVPPDAVTTALAARMSVAPDVARLGLIDGLVRALKTGGVWAKLELLYLLAAHDAQAARLNWVQDAFNLSLVNAPVFTVDRGYASDGVSGCLDSGYNPLAQDLPLNGSAIGVWCRDAALGSGSPIGCRNGGGSNPALFVSTRVTGDLTAGRVHQNANSSASVASAAGLTMFDRSSASAVRVYRDGVDIGGDSAAASSRPGYSLYLCARNSAGTAEALDTRQIAMAAVAKASLSADEHAALHAGVRAYLTGVGAA